MANWLLKHINKHLTHEDSVLDLCCGNGDLSSGLVHRDIVGVDACPEYLNLYKRVVKNSKTVCIDLSKLSHSTMEEFSSGLYDVVLCIDGVEHLERPAAELLISKIESLATKKVVIFTPENCDNPESITLNTPKNTWGIAGGDDWQIHRSAFPRTYWADRGYSCHQLLPNPAINVYDGSKYWEMMYVKEFK